MDIALTAQFCQNYFENGSNDGAATNVEVIRSLLGLATGAMMAVGESFKQIKDELGREFGGWLYSNEFVPSDANKLIKLFDYFGDNFDVLSSVSPLQLLRLLVPSQSVSRSELADFIEECNEAGCAVSCADIDSIQKQYKIKPVPTIQSPAPQTPAPAPDESNVDLGMVGNQQGGVGIFRLEVKDYQLANELDTQWRESGFTANQWIRFMSSSVRVVQEISQVLLGRTIADESELNELLVALKGNKVEVTKSDVFVSNSQIEVASGDGLPTAVSDCLKKINELDSKIASCTEPFGTHAMMRRVYKDERDDAIASLKMLAVEHELDMEMLPLTFMSGCC